ncbi:hypothetical protein B0H11DRAFT_1921005 [Mycena galericulata]|nr:hypothetical protein B0H11DRAFT_1921005 [Mycena galericulata]
MDPSEDETMYQSAFSVVLNQAISKSNVDFSAIGGSFFEPAALTTDVSGCKTATNAEERGIADDFPAGGVTEAASVIETLSAQLESNHEIKDDITRHGPSIQDNRSESERRRSIKLPQRTTMEEVEDEDLIEFRSKPKAENGVLESTEPEIEEEVLPVPPRPKDWQSLRRARAIAQHSKMAEEFWLRDGKLFGQSNSEEEADDDEEDTWNELERIEKETFYATDSGQTRFESQLEADSFSNKQPHTNADALKDSTPKEIIPVQLFKRRQAHQGQSSPSQRSQDEEKEGEIWSREAHGASSF